MIKKIDFPKKLKETKKFFRGLGLGFRVPNFKYDNTGLDLFISTDNRRYGVSWIKDSEGNVLDVYTYYYKNRKDGWTEFDFQNESVVLDAEIYEGNSQHKTKVSLRQFINKLFDTDSNYRIVA